ncbi:hypothetical protein HYU23_01745 [Candidatus Woesearchaeota archaeon]|nr:hypothetical protein [Candidatus Woesearchaeota archaeon]
MKGVFILLFIILILISGCVTNNNIATKSEVQNSNITVGYVGCSNTRQTVYGYQLVEGNDIWVVNMDNIHDYDSGSVNAWARDVEINKFWEVFNNHLAQYPKTNTIWWQLCIPKGEAKITYEQTFPVIETLREKIPNVTIYISPLAEYTENVCEITGVDGIERGISLAEELDLKNDDVLPGPVLGPLSLAEISDKGKDRCHPNEGGMRKMGEQLKQFFGKKSVNTAAIENFEENSTDSNIKVSSLVEKELTFEEKIWKKRIDDSIAPTPCPDINKLEFPSNYYQGPLIDTHLHIPAIPDGLPEEGEEYSLEEELEGRFGGPGAVLGFNIKMSQIACNLKREGTMKNFAFFPVYQEIPLQLLEIWNDTMYKYPEIFTPFIMSSGNDNEPNGFPTVDSKTLREMLAVYPNLFKGYGEIGLYARENGGSPALSPDSQMLTYIYPIIREENLVIYFHLEKDHKDNFETVLEQNPDINFIWHGDQLSISEVEDVLNKHPNAYYGIDDFWGGDRNLFLMFVGKSKNAYLDATNKKFDDIINKDVKTWKSVIERHPDQLIWGTDRGDAVWNYDLEVGQMQVKIARAFIGRLDPSVQEKFAYKNAERIFAERQ